MKRGLDIIQTCFLRGEWRLYPTKLKEGVYLLRGCGSYTGLLFSGKIGVIFEEILMWLTGRLFSNQDVLLFKLL